MRYYVVEPCTTSGGFEIKLEDGGIDLEMAEGVFSSLGKVVAKTPVVLLVQVDNYSISVYKSGRMMVKCDEKMDQEKADGIAGRIIRALVDGGSI